MDSKPISVEDFALDILNKWKDNLRDDRKKEMAFPVITLNMQAGSRGYRVARKVAERLGFDLFHTELLDEMAKTGQVSKDALASIEKGRHKGLQDFVASLIDDQYLHADTYMKYLKYVITKIGKTGHAVIVGRGANYILPPEKRFGVRIISTMDARIKNVANDFSTTKTEAKKRVRKRGAARKSFIKENFGLNIQNPENYDIVLNTSTLSLDVCAEIIVAGYISAQTTDRFENNNAS